MLIDVPALALILQLDDAGIVRHRGVGVIYERPEVLSGLHLLFGSQLLVAEHQHMMFAEECVEMCCFLSTNGAHVNVVDDGTQWGGESSNFRLCHGGLVWFKCGSEQGVRWPLLTV